MESWGVAKEICRGNDKGLACAKNLIATGGLSNNKLKF